MNILGISAFYHDSAACLITDGQIAAAAQEERFTRKKHDFSFPVNACRYCLKEKNLTIKDIDVISFYDKPFIKFERILQTYLQYAPSGFLSFIKAMPLWIREKIWMKEIISRELSYSGKIIFPEHHESHAASAFFPSPFEHAAFMTMDGVGEWATTSWGIGNNNKINIKAEMHFPHSIGLLYSAFTYYTGFKVNSGEYKIMGLAPYGEPKYTKLIYDNIIDLKEDGSLRLDMDYFNYCAGLTMTSQKFNKLFGGPPRKPESALTQKEMDLARSIQEVTEEVVLRTARHVHSQTDEPNLCLAGGVALNCVANGRLLREGPFRNIWIQPAAGDAGGALGAALVAWHHYLGNKRSAVKPDAQHGSYLGPSFSNSEISQWLDNKKIPYEVLSDEALPKRIADLIASENVIGWFHGRMEFGPRALGARSIIGDARSKDMQSKMNLKIKFRESFRPFAPSVTEEKTGEYFDIQGTSPYMLMVAQVNNKLCINMNDEQNKLFGIEKLNVVRSTIPAITHVDYSARIQSVSRETNPMYHAVISELDKNHGCAAIINTSFNVRGEPIVCTPQDAWMCFMRTGMDYLILENCLLDKKMQKKLENDINWKKQFVLD